MKKAIFITGGVVALLVVSYFLYEKFNKGTNTARMKGKMQRGKSDE